MASAVQKAFLEHFSFQCGYCTPGFVNSATVLMEQLQARPVDADAVEEAVEAALDKHICRCTGYVRYYHAVRDLILATPGLTTGQRTRRSAVMDKAQRSKFTKIAAGIAAAAVVVLGGMYIAGSASGSVPPATVDFANISAEQKQKLFDRGLQVFRAADCAACHSSPTTGAELAGGMAMVTPMGTLYGTNISPSKEHGIGQWSADDLYRAVARGMAPGRKNLYPAMPYASYHDITRADVDALWVWLQAQPAVEVANRQPEMNFPFSIRPGLALWNALERPRVNPPRGSNAGSRRLSGQHSGPLRRMPYAAHQQLCHGPQAVAGGQCDRRRLRPRPAPQGHGRARLERAGSGAVSAHRPLAPGRDDHGHVPRAPAFECAYGGGRPQGHGRLSDAG
jgi:hypothetical protein